MPLTTARTREIIRDFQEIIVEKRIKTREERIIHFRNDRIDKKKRPVYLVDLDLLRYRKENGRIASSVPGYEKERGFLDPTNKQSQDKIAEFLREKDPEKTRDLEKMILADGQQEPGIITCDGFLVNGNRRRVVLETLHNDNPAREEFTRMKVVILPGEGEEGGPPTLKEIEQIENRYQLQTDGKADYYGFDAALSIRNKIELGFSLEEQLRDNALYRNMPKREFGRVLRREQEKLTALDCIDRYLESFERPSQYRHISKGIGDREGRWQAFVDYAKVWNNLQKTNAREKFKVEELDMEVLEQVAFKAIRLREIPSVGKKIHVVMRDLPKLWKYGKTELIRLNEDVDTNLPQEEQVDAKGNELSLAEIDKKWQYRHKTAISYHFKAATEMAEKRIFRQQPLNLLRDAQKKLSHPDLEISRFSRAELEQAQKIANNIQELARGLCSEIFAQSKKLQKLARSTSQKNDS